MRGSVWEKKRLSFICHTTAWITSVGFWSYESPRKGVGEQGQVTTPSSPLSIWRKEAEDPSGWDLHGDFNEMGIALSFPGDRLDPCRAACYFRSGFSCTRGARGTQLLV